MKNPLFTVPILLLVLLGGCAANQESSIEQDESDSQDVGVEAVPTPAFISVHDPKQVSRSENGAYYLSGTISGNCSEIWVEAENIGSGLYDNYQLSEFTEGDTDFRYGIRADWNNLANGDNTYTFTAYCDGGQEVSDTAAFSYSAPLPTYTYTPTPTYDYSAPAPTYTYPSTLPSDSYESYSYSNSTVKQLINSGAYLLSTCDDTYVFLGTFGDHYDSDSIFSKYGDYGSKYSDTSVWYQYGDYGGSYDDCSAFYSYASEPPMIMVGDTIIGYLSKYSYAGTKVIDPNEVLFYAYQEFDDDYYLDLMRD